MPGNTPKENYESSLENLTEALREANSGPTNQEILQNIEDATEQLRQVGDERDAAIEQRNELANEAALRIGQAADAIESQNYQDAERYLDELQREIDETSDRNIADQPAPGNDGVSRREAIVGLLSTGALAGGIGYLLGGAENSSEEAATTQPSSGNTGTQSAGHINFGADLPYGIDEGVALFEYVDTQTTYENLPFDMDDLREYNDGEGVEFTRIEAILKEGEPTNDSYIGYVLEKDNGDLRAVKSGGVDDGAVEIITGYAEHDGGDVQSYIESLEGEGV